MVKTLQRLIRFGFLDYWRNGTLSFSATLIVGVTLFIIAVFSLQSYVIKATTASIQDKLDMAVYLSDNPSEDDVAAFVLEVKSYTGVKEVVYLNKEQVLAEWRGLTIDDRIKNQVSPENNPLPRTIKIKTDDPAELETVAAKISASGFNANIRNLSYRNNRPVIQALNDRAKASVKNGIIVSTLFSVLSILFLFHTIRVIIKFRADEIGVMKLVGATNAFVLGPFLVEAVLHGLIGGILAYVGLWLYLTNGLSSGAAISASTDSLVTQGIQTYFQTHSGILLAELIGTGIVVSLICVWLSLRKHLKGVGV